VPARLDAVGVKVGGGPVAGKVSTVTDRTRPPRRADELTSEPQSYTPQVQTPAAGSSVSRQQMPADLKPSEAQRWIREHQST